ncbi:hypothetical protein WA026_022793 [Henosepilachna vigintioctopunctata]|uniref:Uncharacterized protein n=1 Tax=Henosepilachna vigintioctopunctata TaxID=420089 RepID=A0AAW1VJD8_9CUCU
MLMIKSGGELITQSADNLAQNASLAESNGAQIFQSTIDLVQNVNHENKTLGNSPQPSCSRNYTSIQRLVETDKAPPLPRTDFHKTNRKRAKSDILSGSAYKLTLKKSLVPKKVSNNVTRNPRKRDEKPKCKRNCRKKRFGDVQRALKSTLRKHAPLPQKTEWDIQYAPNRGKRLARLVRVKEILFATSASKKK